MSESEDRDVSGTFLTRILIQKVGMLNESVP